MVNSLMKSAYSPADIARLHVYLSSSGCFTFHPLPNGLFSAAATEADAVSGYQYVWVRDNIHIAHAHWVCGDAHAAGRTASTLLKYFQLHQSRFENAIQNGRPSNPMHRPHIRFDGGTLKELPQKWAHAQNDALGYFLWLYCKLAIQGIVTPDESAWKCLANFPRYFQAIQYWNDPDSGHWEEERKVSASSIGTVLAGLREFKALASRTSPSPGTPGEGWGEGSAVSLELIDNLLLQGTTALEQILPWESRTPLATARRYDGALLFLIYPLQILNRSQADRILQDIAANLMGDYGIRRYLGDSYWCPDYKQKLTAEARTADSSDAMESRNALAEPGREAQWCIFDSVISAAHGQRYLAATQHGTDQEAARELQRQIEFFNRALGQITGANSGVPECRMPEAYFIEQGRYVPNDHTPLYWAQANLWLALHCMQESLSM
jgi:phosphorylase kinase alpha/beta subunit